MSTEEIIWTIVIIVAVLALIAFVVAAMRKKSRRENESRAAELRQEADQRAAVIPDASVRAKETEAAAERARLEAEQAQERAQAARAEVSQQQALREDQIREADRLDPNVDHKSRDYAPDTSISDSRTTGTGGTHTSDESVEGGTERTSTSDPDTIFDSRDSDTTTTRSTTEAERIDPDGTDGGTSGGAHRA